MSLNVTFAEVAMFLFVCQCFIIFTQVMARQDLLCMQIVQKSLIQILDQ